MRRPVPAQSLALDWRHTRSYARSACPDAGDNHPSPRCDSHEPQLTELLDEEYRVFLDSRKDFSRWDVVRLAWVADYNDAGSFLDTFRSGSANDDSGYENAQFNALVDEAERTADIQTRRE